MEKQGEIFIQDFPEQVGEAEVYFKVIMEEAWEYSYKQLQTQLLMQSWEQELDIFEERVEKIWKEQ